MSEKKPLPFAIETEVSVVGKCFEVKIEQFHGPVMLVAAEPGLKFFRLNLLVLNDAPEH